MTTVNLGNLYFISEEFFSDFPDPLLMGNKNNPDDYLHNRPCFYALKEENSELFWMIPISSKIEKYKRIYEAKLIKLKRKDLDTIVFGKVIGNPSAFLIQNMFPVTEKYILNEYIDKVTGFPVVIDDTLKKSLYSKARRVLSLQRHGVKLILPDVLTIEQQLIKTLK